MLEATRTDGTSMNVNMRSRIWELKTNETTLITNYNLCIADTDVQEYVNYDLTNVQTPVKVDRLQSMLRQAEYDTQDADFLVQGFREGFDLGYEGPIFHRDTSRNLPLTVGNKLELWNKVMKEVKLKRYAGLFGEIPFDYYIQSPIGFVSKAKDQTRLIFHLSYDFKQTGNKSVNYYTPEHLCSVKYRDLDHAVCSALHLYKLVKDGVI